MILPLADGYELAVGYISEESGSAGRKYWAWSAPRVNDRAETRDEAMAAFRKAWLDVTKEDITKMRRQQEYTENKYVLFDAGYRDQIRLGAINCPCGATFDPKVHEETMAHIGHIKGEGR